MQNLCVFFAKLIVWKKYAKANKDMKKCMYSSKQGQTQNRTMVTPIVSISLLLPNTYRPEHICLLLAVQ